MNWLEGARRLRLLGKKATFGGIAAILFSSLGILVLNHTDLALAVIGLGHLAAGVAFGSLVVSVLGGLLWIAGYILEGFALPRAHREGRSPATREDTAS